MLLNTSEDRAVNYLKKNGFVILSRNRRIGGVEIDIMGLRKNNPEKTYYLIEVKRVSRHFYKLGYPPVSFFQIQRYLRAIEDLNINCGKFLDVRFALMIFDEKNEIIDFVENMPFLNMAS